MKLIALRGLSYDGQHLRAGEIFEAEARFAKVLKAIGRAADHVDTKEDAPVVPDPSEEPASVSAPSSPESKPEATATGEDPMSDVQLTPVEPMTTKDNGALVPTRRGKYGRRDIEPGQTAVMTPEPGAAPDDGAAV